MEGSGLNQHVDVVVEVNGFLLAKIIASLVKNSLFLIDNCIVFGRVAVFGYLILLLFQFSDFSIKRRELNSDVILWMLREIDLAHLERGRAV